VPSFSALGLLYRHCLSALCLSLYLCCCLFCSQFTGLPCCLMPGYHAGADFHHPAWIWVWDPTTHCLPPPTYHHTCHTTTTCLRLVWMPLEQANNVWCLDVWMRVLPGFGWVGFTPTTTWVGFLADTLATWFLLLLYTSWVGQIPGLDSVPGRYVRCSVSAILVHTIPGY